MTELMDDVDEKAMRAESEKRPSLFTQVANHAGGRLMEGSSVRLRNLGMPEEVKRAIPFPGAALPAIAPAAALPPPKPASLGGGGASLLHAQCRGPGRGAVYTQKKKRPPACAGRGAGRGAGRDPYSA